MEERLQKIIARAGIASRRHAEQLILSGAVTVNGRVVTQLGTKADAAKDHIAVGPRVIRLEQREAPAYFAFYKPPHVVSTLNDPEGRPCLGPYIRSAKGRLFPVGRLEFDASGLLVLTSDGVLASDLMRATAAIPQIWRFKVRGRIPDEMRQQIEREARVQLRLHREGENPWYEADVTNAPRDIVRQTLFRRGFPVEKVVRAGFAGIGLAGIAPGEMRELSPEELRGLRRAARGEAVSPEAKHARADHREHDSIAHHGAQKHTPRFGFSRSERRPQGDRPPAPRSEGHKRWGSGGRDGAPRHAGDRRRDEHQQRGSHGRPPRTEHRPWKKSATGEFHPEKPHGTTRSGAGGYRSKPHGRNASGSKSSRPPKAGRPFRGSRPGKPRR